MRDIRIYVNTIVRLVSIQMSFRLIKKCNFPPTKQHITPRDRRFLSLCRRYKFLKARKFDFL